MEGEIVGRGGWRTSASECQSRWKIRKCCPCSLSMDARACVCGPGGVCNIGDGGFIVTQGHDI